MKASKTLSKTLLAFLTWDKIRPNLLPFGICLGLLGVSMVQAVYFRADLRRNMLENGRRTHYKISPDKKDWLFEASKLFDKDTQSFSRIPLMKGDPSKKAELSIELALTHFPSPAGNPLPLPRRPILIEIYNGACVSCPLSVFQKHKRIREAKLELLLRRLNFPIVDHLLPEEIGIWQKKILFPDKPGAQKVNFDWLPFFGTNPIKEVSVLIFRIHVLSTYPGSVENESISLAEIRYADQDFFKKDKLHYWE